MNYVCVIHKTLHSKTFISVKAPVCYFLMSNTSSGLLHTECKENWGGQNNYPTSDFIDLLIYLALNFISEFAMNRASGTSEYYNWWNITIYWTFNVHVPKTLTSQGKEA